MNPKRPATLEPLAPAALLVLAAHAVLVLLVMWGRQETHRSKSSGVLVWMNPAEFRDPLAGAEIPKAVLVKPPPAVTAKKTITPAPPKAAPKPPPQAPVAKATLVAAPPQQAMPAPVEGAPLFAGAAVPKPSANRAITLRRAIPKAKPVISAEIQVTAPPLAGATLSDMARLSRFRPALPSLPPPPPEQPDTLPPGLNMDAVDNAVNAAFHTAWTAPPLDAVPANQRSARLTISIGKDGKVISSQMIQPSGSHALDNSILAAVAKVPSVPATLPSQFPKASYDLELTFNILP
jgi:TonB family protein